MKWILVIVHLQFSASGEPMKIERGFPMESWTACQQALKSTKVEAGPNVTAAALCTKKADK